MGERLLRKLQLEAQDELLNGEIFYTLQEDRPHSALAGRTPDEFYVIEMQQEKLAA